MKTSKASAVASKLLVTIDVESHIGNMPIDSQIWGRTVDGLFGIPKIIEILDEYGVQGLFFVDIAECYSYDEAAIHAVLEYIKEKGHAVGVHIHPHHMPGEQRHFLWQMSKEEQRDIIQRCTDKFIELTGATPASFRAGKYGANQDTLDILCELGYQYDFSQFFGQSWCKIPNQVAVLLPQKYKSLMEFPVTCFNSFPLGCFYNRFDKLEMTIPTSELCLIVDAYQATSYQEVLVLFLHSFSLIDYVTHPDTPTPNYQNINRFKRSLQILCAQYSYSFIGEDELRTIAPVQEDTVNNILKTPGWLNRVFYFYWRAIRICSYNKKAKLLLLGTLGSAVCLLILFLSRLI